MLAVARLFLDKDRAHKHPATRRELFGSVVMIMPVSQAIARQDPMHLLAKKMGDAIA